MAKPNRIAAGGIILKEDSVLLVRYPSGNGSTYLVGPGGALEGEENAFEAVVRETVEETGVRVRPSKILFVEQLICSRFMMCKIWALCELVGGEVRRTEGARAEGVVDAGWFKKDALAEETVFPAPLAQHDWKAFLSDTWHAACLPTRRTAF